MVNRVPILLVMAAAALVSVSRAQEQRPPAERGRGQMIERIRNALDELDLTAEQKIKTDEILADAADQLAKLREDAAGNLDALREKAGGVIQNVRQKLFEVLTPAQQRQLTQRLPRLREQPAEGQKPDPKPAEATMGEMMGDKPAAISTPSSSATPKSAEASPAGAPDDKFAPGTPAPDFRLKNLDGKIVSLANLRGRPTVLIFGSFTSPTFRDKVGAFNGLRKEFRNKANVLIVYTREAYPNLEWDVQRNIDEQIRIAHHTSIEERQKMAKMTRDGLKIDADVLVDDMDDAVAAVYDAMPNGCVVLDAAGKILIKQKWAEVHGVRDALNGALRAR